LDGALIPLRAPPKEIGRGTQSPIPGLGVAFPYPCDTQEGQARPADHITPACRPLRVFALKAVIELSQNPDSVL
jgi:hypothetical protein